MTFVLGQFDQKQDTNSGDKHNEYVKFVIFITAVIFDPTQSLIGWQEKRRSKP